MVAIFTGAGAGFQRGSANILGGAGQIGNSALGRATESVSVNAATGNLLISRQDEFLVGLGPDVGISRTYNSLQDAADGDNGDHWQQSTTRRVFGLTGTLNAAGSTVQRLSGDGSVIVYSWDSTANAYLTSEGQGAFDKLTNSAGVWTWTDGDSRVTETYSAHGTGNWRIVASADQDGNALAFTYVGDKLDKVTTADGGWTQYAWSGNNISQILTGYTDLQTSTSETLTRVRYAYDGSNRLVSVTTDLSPEDSAVADGETYTVSYTYDGTSNRVASITQSDGSHLAISYDGSGRVQALTQTVATGASRLTTLSYGANYTQVTGPDGKVTRLDYDGSGRLTKITAPPATSGAASQTVQFGYDAQGNVITVTDGKGKITEYDHDANGNVILVTDANGDTIQRSYDSSNRLVTELVYGADESGPSAAHYTQYAYDGEGHLRFAVNAAGQVTEYEYTAAGLLLRTIRYPEHAYAVGPSAISAAGMESWVAGLGSLASAQITENAYDARGNLQNVTSFGTANAAGTALTSEGASKTYSVYDQAGRLLERHNEGEQSETYVYDGLGRLVASTDVNGGTTTIIFNDAATTTTVTSALGYSTVSTFNKAGELVGKVESGANTAGAAHSYQYDAQGRLRVISLGDASPNLLEDSSFESDNTYGFYDPGYVSSYLDETVSHSGGKSVRAEVVAVGGQGSGHSYAKRIYQDIVPANQALTYSIWVMGEAGTNGYIRLTGGAGGTYQYSTQSAENSFTIAQTNVWQRISVTLQVDTSVEQVQLRFGFGDNSYIPDSSVVQVGNVLHFDDLQLETGSIATPWQSGGVNLLPASSFESDTSQQLFDPTYVLGAKDDVVSHNGGTSMRMEVLTLGGQGGGHSYGAQLIQDIVPSDQSLTFSAWVRGEAGVKGYIRMFGGEQGHWENWHYSDLNVSQTFTIAETDTWQRVSITLPVNQAIDRVQLRFGFADSQHLQIGDVLHFDDLQLETNPAATPWKPAGLDGVGSERTSYIHYDAAGRKVADVNHLGELIEYRYDAADRIIATIAYASPLSGAALATLSDPNNGVDLASLLPTATAEDPWSWNVYDDGGRLIQVIDNAGGTVVYEYDDSGNLVRTTAYSTQLTAGQLSGFKTTLPTALVLPANAPSDAVSRLFYNEAGQLAARLDGEGYLSETVYDTAGQAIESIAYATPTLAADRANGSLETLRDYVRGGSLVDRVSHSVYDGQGLLRFTVDVLGGVRSFEYDPAGRLTKSTTYAKTLNLNDFTFDTVKAAIVSDTSDSSSWTVYDDAGRAAYTIDAGGGVTSFEYDAQGRPIKSVAFANLYDTSSAPAFAGMNDWAANVAQANDTDNRVSRSFYSGRGELLFSVDPLGYVTGYTYDAQGRALAKTAYSTAIVVNDATTISGLQTLVSSISDNITVSTTYDGAGRVLTQTDGEGFVTRNAYNALGQLTDVYRADGTASAVATHYVYDGAGQLIEQISADGSADEIAVHFAYDGLGNQIETTDPNGNVTTYAYDRLGRLGSVTNALAGVTSYEYDSFGNVVKVVEPTGATTFSYYDALNRLIATRDAEGYVTRIAYNRFGEVVLSQRYSTAIVGPGETGVVFFDEDDVPPASMDPFDYAALLQATANALDAQADAAEASVPGAIQAAATAAQAASDADDLVDDLEAQIAALGGGGAISFEDARTAALADMNAWLLARREWLDDAKGAADPLDNGTSGLEKEEFSSFLDMFRHEKDVANDLKNLSSTTANNAKKAAYINQYYDNLTLQANSLGSDRVAALASPLAWLQSRQADLENWNDSFHSLSGSNKFDEVYEQIEDLWSDVRAALYDLQNNTYSTGWPSSDSQIASWYNSVQSNPSYVPNNINNTSQQTSDYRAEIIINAYFDVFDVVDYEGGSSPLQGLLAQLAQAEGDAAAAHTAADAAQVAATAAQASATSLRAEATQAQSDADAALTAAQNGTAPINRDNFVLLDAATLGLSAKTYFEYDKLGRTSQKVDAEGYVETYDYDAFGDLVAFSRYQLSVYDLVPEELPPDVIAAYEAADTLQTAADNLATQAANAAASADTLQATADGVLAAVAPAQTLVNTRQATVNSLNNQIANHPANSVFQTPLPHLQTYRSEVAQEASYWYSIASSASTSDPLYYEYWDLYDYYLNLRNSIDAEIASVQASNPLSTQGKLWAMQGAGYTQQEVDSYNDLQNDLYTATAALNTAQSALTSAQNAATSAQNQANNAYANAASLQSQATNKQAEADAALIAAQNLEAAFHASQDTSELPDFELSELGNQAESLFEYDNRGQLSRTTDAMGFFETYAYDAYGRRTSVNAKSSSAAVTAGGTTSYEYDNRGLLVSETLPIQSYNSTGTELGLITNSYQYDERGNLIRRIEAVGLPEERTTEYEYDDLDRLILTRHDNVTGLTINASTKAVSSVSGNPVETIEYDGNGNVIKTVDASGAKTVFFYDGLNRKTAEINALGTFTAYEYDPNGNVSRIRIFQNTVSVPTTGGSSSQAPTIPSGAKRETTFTYDGLGRLLTSNVLGVTTGELVGTSWNSSTAALTTSYQYDAFGNVAKVTDPNGNHTYSYYDRLGRKTDQVDSEGYHTAWSYDAEGHVLTETRYATKGVGTPSLILPPETDSDPANDRVTQYAYDLNGNRLSELRSNVVIHNGSGGTTTATSAIYYAYNGLGQVTVKVEATGDETQYAYDAGGRLITETRESFSSFTGQSVTPQVGYQYDGLGNLVRLTEAGGGGEPAKVTRYDYGAAGRLSKVTDAAGNAREYAYDVAGRLVLEHYDRTATNTNGSTTTIREGVGYRYDALGRVLGQAYYTKPSASWQFQSGNEYTTMAYNAFGDVVSVAFNRSSTDISSKGYQQQNQYDLAGRLTATNAGDGLWKHFGYDKNGNQTLTIATGGASLAGKTFSQALAMIGQTTVNATYVKYDKRGLATQIVEEDRQLSGTSTVDLTTNRTYNAFGDVASETDALGHTTDFTYNTMGRLVEKKSPQVAIVTEAGVTQNVRPTEKYYYDASGRLVAQKDANGNLTKLTLLAGTGYDGGQALVTQVIQAGGGTVTTQYDVHGNTRKITDQIGRVTNQTFDAMGRVLTVARQGAATQSYAYDQHGRQVKHWNSVYGSSDAEISKFDIQGRVAGSRTYGGEVTNTAYAWNDTASTNAIGNFGGWMQTVTADGYTRVTATDLFGRRAGADYTYDAAGRLSVDQTDANVAGQINYQYYNTGNLKYKHETTFVTRDSIGDTAGKEAWFSYDELGRLKTEKLTTYKVENFWFDPGAPGETAYWDSHDFGGTLQDSTATYDAMGRLVSVHDNYGNFDKSWAYDANGNVRKIVGSHSGTTSTTEWYRYDALNRVTLAKGDLVSGAIVRGSDGISLTYDAASQRASSQTGSAAAEYYTYNDLGLVSEVLIGSSSGTPRVTSSYDALGRLNGHIEKDASGNVVFERFDIQYNSRNQILREKSRVHQDNGDWIYNHTVNHYNDTGHSFTASDPALITGSSSTGSSSGNLLYFSRTKSWVNGTVVSGTGTPGYGSAADNSLTDAASEHHYEWHEDKGFLETIIGTTNQYGSGSTSQEYDGAGNIVDADRTNGPWGEEENFRYATDAYGQIISREEYDDTQHYAVLGLPSTHTYRFGGREIGIVSNDGTDNVDYATLISHRDDTGSGSFRYGSNVPTNYSDFDSNHVTMAAGAQGETPGSYTAQGGETLQDVAAVVWGDANLWYKLAEANGISGGMLHAGQRLIIPNSVVGIHNNADTIKPYDPNRALGDINPPHVSPPRTAGGDGCGAFGQILVAALAIAVSVATYGVLTAPATSVAGAGVLAGGGFASVAAGGISGAVGSIASQGFANGIGVQEGFSWKGVGLAALGGAVGGALAPGGIFENGAFGEIGSGVAASALRAGASSALTQGIGLATGLQDKFSWAGVAAAGIGAGVGYAMGRVLGAKPLTVDNTLPNQLANLGANTASLIASAGTRSAIEGSNFGDNIRAGLPDVIGQAINNVVGYGLSLPKEEVDSSPVAGGGSFRSVGAEWEHALKLPASLSEPSLPEKFGGPRSSQFDNSVHLGPEGWLQWGQETLASAWDGVESTFDGWVGRAERAWDNIAEEVIVVTANVIDYVSWNIDHAARFAVDISERIVLSQLEVARGQRIQSQATGQMISSGFRQVQQFNDTNFSRGQVPRVMDYMAPPTGALSGAFDPATPLLFAQHPEMVSGVRPLKYGDVVNPIVEVGGAAYIAFKAPTVLGKVANAGEARAAIVGVESAAPRFVPNPYGRLGGPSHVAAADVVKADIAARGLNVGSEFRVLTPNGEKGWRFIDVVGIDPKTGLAVEFYQIGRQTKGGLPVARETRAITDIKIANPNIHPNFVPYNK